MLKRLFRPELPPNPVGPRFWTIVGQTAIVGPFFGGLIVWSVILTWASIALLLGPAETGLGIDDAIESIFFIVIGAYVVGAVPAALSGIALAIFRPRLGWKLSTALIASVFPILFILLLGMLASVAFGGWYGFGVSIPVALLSVPAAALTWRFTLRRKGPPPADLAQRTADVFA